MRKIIMSILFFGLTFGFFVQAATTSTLPDPGLTPDSPFYFLKAWKESIQTFFTFGTENKAKQYLHLAEVRLAEYQRMIEKGKTEIADKTLVKYENQLNRALDKIKELQDKGQDIKDLSQKIQEAVSKHLEVLQENLQKVPEQARQGIENAIENSSKVLEQKSGVQISNPASVYCENNGGKLEIRNDAEGNQTGFCVFSDASECEEWAFFRGECKKGDIKSETSNWQTYKNEQYGFEFKYPSDLYIGDKLSPAISFEFPGILSLVSLEDKFSKIFTFMIFDNSKQLTIPAWIEKNRPGYYQDDVKVSDVVISGLPAKQYLTIKGAEFNTYLIKDNLMYTIDWHSYNPGDQENFSRFKQILSTFKFIEPIDTSTWQTYRNEAFNYEIKYPKVGSVEAMFTIAPLSAEDLKTYAYISIIPGANKDELGIVIYVYPIKTSLDENINDSLKDPLYGGTKMIGGVEAQWYVIDGVLKDIVNGVEHGSMMMDTSDKIFFLEKNGLVYRFILPNLDSEITNQILSTFKFTK